MTRAVRLFKRSFSLLFLAGMMFVLSACSSAEASKQNNEYYEQLSKCTDTFLMKNRELCVCDEEKIMADCRQAAGELAKSING